VIGASTRGGYEMRRFWIALGMAAAFGLGGGGTVVAQDTTQCLTDAVDARKACKAECKDDFQTAVFNCKNVNPECGKACLEGRARCMQPFVQVLEDCLDGCRAQLEGDKADCQTRCSGDQACLDPCIDAAQVTAFICRDNCRESFRANESAQEGIKNCRAAFRACVHACPPAS
jgi:hypothetical protein